MRTILLSVVLAVAALGGCANKDAAPPVAEKPSAQVPEITIDELAAGLAAGEWQAVDANGEATRKKLGVIPGAVLLSDSELFSTSELPANKSKPLVFYCANTHCGASHEAAGRALTAGYTNVKVLPDGIAGWVKAGKQVTRI